MTGGGFPLPDWGWAPLIIDTGDLIHPDNFMALIGGRHVDTHLETWGHTWIPATSVDPFQRALREIHWRLYTRVDPEKTR